MRRRTRRAARAARGNVAGWILGSLGVLVIVAIAGTATVLNLQKSTTDRSSGCPTDKYDSVTAVLIDLTDPLNPTQTAALKNALLKVRGDTPKFGRLEIYPLRSTTQSTLAPSFGGCSPGSGRDVDSRWYGNPELADRLWRKQFADKVDQAILELRNLPSENASPILEGIQSAAVTAFGGPLAVSAHHKRLLIVSDMIHHTGELSMYAGAPHFEKFKTTQYYLKTKPSLRDASVDVYLVVRETRRNVQQPPLYKFWVDYVANAEGYLRHWEPLQ